VITSLTPPAPAPLVLPDGRKVADVEHGPLYGELARLVPNFSHNLGRTDAIALYARHLQVWRKLPDPVFAGGSAMAVGGVPTVADVTFASTAS
jgi:hypothetical protein